MNTRSLYLFPLVAAIVAACADQAVCQDGPRQAGPAALVETAADAFFDPSIAVVVARDNTTKSKLYRKLARASKNIDDETGDAPAYFMFRRTGVVLQVIKSLSGKLPKEILLVDSAIIDVPGERNGVEADPPVLFENRNSFLTFIKRAHQPGEDLLWHRHFATLKRGKVLNEGSVYRFAKGISIYRISATAETSREVVLSPPAAGDLALIYGKFKSRMRKIPLQDAGRRGTEVQTWKKKMKTSFGALVLDSIVRRTR